MFSEDFDEECPGTVFALQAQGFGGFPERPRTFGLKALKRCLVRPVNKYPGDQRVAVVQHCMMLGKAPTEQFVVKTRKNRSLNWSWPHFVISIEMMETLTHRSRSERPSCHKSQEGCPRVCRIWKCPFSRRRVGHRHGESGFSSTAIP